MISRRAFTLIELLVVIGIIAGLMGMLMPIVTIAGRAARKSATRSVMIKIDTAARLFRSDIGSYPWQQTYADLAAGAPWTNRLYYHLGTDISASDYDKIRADANTTAALYAFDKNAPAASPHAFLAKDLAVSYPNGGKVAMLNRMAAERARLAIYAGNVSISGCVLPIPYPADPTYVRRVLPIGPLLATPTSAASPGWAKDYLNGELETRFVSGETVLDGWKHPLIYVGQVVEGMTSGPVLSLMGLPAATLRSLDFGLQPLGRKTLAQTDKITGLALTVDPVELPSLSDLRHSDRRHYAAPGLEVDIEFWSAGPDGRADWMRDAAVNTDNVSLLPYDKRIP